MYKSFSTCLKLVSNKCFLYNEWWLPHILWVVILGRGIFHLKCLFGVHVSRAVFIYDSVLRITCVPYWLNTAYVFNIVLNNAFMSVASRTCKEWGQYECRIHEALKAVFTGSSIKKMHMGWGDDSMVTKKSTQWQWIYRFRSLNKIS